jgi:hypothetical protein
MIIFFRDSLLDRKMETLIVENHICGKNDSLTVFLEEKFGKKAGRVKWLVSRYTRELKYHLLDCEPTDSIFKKLKEENKVSVRDTFNILYFKDLYSFPSRQVLWVCDKIFWCSACKTHYVVFYEKHNARQDPDFPHLYFYTRTHYVTSVLPVKEFIKEYIHDDSMNHMKFFSAMGQLSEIQKKHHPDSDPASDSDSD